MRAFDTFRSLKESGNIYYTSLGWGKAEVPPLVEALKYAEEHCDAAKVGGGLKLVLYHNEFDAEDKAALEAAPAVECSALFKVCVYI